MSDLTIEDLDRINIAPRREVRDLPDDLNTFVSADFDTGIDAFSFAARLRDMRALSGLTQFQVAEHLTETLGFPRDEQDDPLLRAKSTRVGRVAFGSTSCWRSRVCVDSMRRDCSRRNGVDCDD